MLITGIDIFGYETGSHKKTMFFVKHKNAPISYKRVKRIRRIKNESFLASFRYKHNKIIG